MLTPVVDAMASNVASNRNENRNKTNLILMVGWCRAAPSGSMHRRARRPRRADGDRLRRDPKVATVGGEVRVVAAENFWGSIAAPARRRQGQVQSIIVNPAAGPPLLRADRPATRARWRPRSWPSSTGSATTRGRRSCSPPTRSTAASCSPSATLFGLKRRATTPTAGMTRPTSRASPGAITADLKKLDPKDAAYFAGGAAAVRDQRSGGLPPS